MRAGRLDRRLTIRQASAPTRNAMNEPVRVWTALGTFWAEEDERAARGMEAVQAGQVRAEQTRVWRLRWSTRTAKIRAADRAVFEGVEYEITNAIEIGRRVGIRITATGPVAAAI